MAFEITDWELFLKMVLLTGPNLAWTIYPAARSQDALNLTGSFNQGPEESWAGCEGGHVKNGHSRHHICLLI